MGPLIVCPVFNFCVNRAASGIDGINQWESIADGTPSPRTEFVYNMDDVNLFHGAIRYQRERDGDGRGAEGE